VSIGWFGALNPNFARYGAREMPASQFIEIMMQGLKADHPAAAQLALASAVQAAQPAGSDRGDPVPAAGK
jgi:hypothetical protein